MNAETLRAALRGQSWLAAALQAIAARPDVVEELFPLARRRCGSRPLPEAPGWTADVAARALLLAALPPHARATWAERLHRHGDTSEKTAVLRALPLLDLGPAAVPLLHDAIRSNDPRLLAAALGPYAVHLDDHSWRHAVLKCVFTGVPLASVHGLDARADAELAIMINDLAAERRAAGRDIPPDAGALLARLTAVEDNPCASSTPTST